MYENISFFESLKHLILKSLNSIDKTANET
jgi:hypothetical protein